MTCLSLPCWFQNELHKSYIKTMNHPKIKCLIKDCNEYAVMRGRCMKCYYGTRQGTKRANRFHRDIDYYHKLNKEELAWLHKFESEEYDANINKKVVPFNNTKTKRRTVYENNYARRVDITLHQRIPNALEDLPTPQNPENNLIELIDLKAQYKKSKK